MRVDAQRNRDWAHTEHCRRTETELRGTMKSEAAEKEPESSWTGRQGKSHPQ